MYHATPYDVEDHRQAGTALARQELLITIMSRSSITRRLRTPAYATGVARKNSPENISYSLRGGRGGRG